MGLQLEKNHLIISWEKIVFIVFTNYLMIWHGYAIEKKKYKIYTGTQNKANSLFLYRLFIKQNNVHTIVLSVLTVAPDPSHPADTLISTMVFVYASSTIPTWVAVAGRPSPVHICHDGSLHYEQETNFSATETNMNLVIIEGESL